MKRYYLIKMENKLNIFIDDGILDISFLKSILNNHFNFEMAKEPSQNLRVQISVNLDNIIILLDIYDDRGFDIYYIPVFP